MRPGDDALIVRKGTGRKGDDMGVAPCRGDKGKGATPPQETSSGIAPMVLLNGNHQFSFSPNYLFTARQASS